MTPTENRQYIARAITVLALLACMGSLLLPVWNQVATLTAVWLLVAVIIVGSN